MKRWKQALLDMGFYVAGSVLYALSVNCFSAPNEIAPGGVTGIATLINHLTGAPIGTLIFVINLPLLAAAFFVLGKRFTLRTGIVTVLVSLMIDVTEPLLPAFRGDRMLVALCGGLLAGLGLGLILIRGATTGGSEIVARLLQKRYHHLPIGRLIFVVDAVIIALSVPVFGELSSALYAAILVFVSALIMDKVIYGGDEGRLLLIITPQPQPLVAAVTAQLHRGITVLSAHGGYTQQERSVLLCAVRRTQLYPLRRLIRETDPAAFTMVVTTQQVFGEGFLPLDGE